MRKGKNMKKATTLILVSALTGVLLADPSWWTQERFEKRLYGICPPDYFPDGDPPDVPLRNRDALTEYRNFLVESGWTTNQFVDALILAFTNNITASNWTNEYKNDIACSAIWKLSEINLPVVTNFFRMCNDDDSVKCKNATIPAMFPYTNLEPEIMSYMRTLCVRTNIYDRAATIVMHDMFDTLETMPDELKPAATNRVAQYMYFAIHHVTDSQGWQDRELANFIPAYSNSVQRLALMSYVAATATNAWEQSNAAAVVQSLSALPTNQLNNISWIEE
jgi:hypothetical protein